MEGGEQSSGGVNRVANPRLASVWCAETSFAPTDVTFDDLVEAGGFSASLIRLVHAAHFTAEMLIIPLRFCCKFTVATCEREPLNLRYLSTESGYISALPSATALRRLSLGRTRGRSELAQRPVGSAWIAGCIDGESFTTWNKNANIKAQ